MRELSVFVDESGDFGVVSKHSLYYLFSLVLHDQQISIDDMIKELDRRMNEHGFEPHAIHSGPIIRNEGYYLRIPHYILFLFIILYIIHLIREYIL